MEHTSLELSEEVISDLALIEHGADVYHRHLAVLYRMAAKEVPPLVRIVKAKENVPGHKQQPYFGAKLTAHGKRVVKQYQDAQAGLMVARSFVRGVLDTVSNPS